MRFNIFKRNRDDNTVAPELQQYYEAEKKERAGLSWLLAVISVAFVSLVLIGLFFGGKWLYNRVTSDDNEVAQVENGAVQEPASPSEPAETAAPAAEPQNTSPAAQSPASAPAASTAPAATPATTTPAATPVTGDSALPNTGPKENLLMVFASSTLVFGLIHNFYSRQTKNN